jgi:hypothetical protein
VGLQATTEKAAGHSLHLIPGPSAERRREEAAAGSKFLSFKERDLG